jgi:hypothetical protein
MSETEVTPLARYIYRQLVRLVRKGTNSLSYVELTEAIADKFTLHPRSTKLFGALTEVTQACRQRELPAVTAIVWKSGAKRPSDGFYKIAYPRLRSFEAQVEAWREEHARVISEAENLPVSL